MDIDYEAIGKRIQFWRKRRSLTQEQLVLFIEREPAYLSRIEHGNQKPRLDALLRVCQALNIDINNLCAKLYTLARGICEHECISPSYLHRAWLRISIGQ